MSERKLWRVGLVGLGSAAVKIHIPAFERLKNVQVVGGSDPEADLSNKGIPHFDSLDVMLEQAKPDVVAIITPPDSHYAIAKQCLEYGVHVFCEKPFVETLEQGADLIHLCNEKRRALVVNQEFRFMRTHESAKQHIGTERFGELQFLSINQTFRTSAETESGWRGRSNRRTCYEFGMHVLDLCRFFFDDEPIALRARMPKPTDQQGPDLLNMIELEFSGDRFAQITLDRLTNGPHRYLDMRLDGTNGTIETTMGGLIELAAGLKGGGGGAFLRLERRASASAKLYNGERGQVIGSDPIDVFPAATARLFEEMLLALSAGSAPPCNASDNLKGLALMLAAYESADRAGERIDMRALSHVEQ